MYLLELQFSNAALNREGGINLNKVGEGLKKWNFISPTHRERDLEFLQLLALASCGCTHYLDRLPCDLTRLLRKPEKNLQLELVWTEHTPTARKIFKYPSQQSALRITPQGQGKNLKKSQTRLLSNTSTYCSFSKWSPPDRHTVCAYGSEFKVHAGTDDFDFSDPFYQLRRIKSLFNKEAHLTDPCAFLNNINYRAVRQRRYMPKQILEALQNLLQVNLSLETSSWNLKGQEFSELWPKLSHVQQDLLTPVLDATRHLHDALPSHSNPLNFPGIIILDRPEHYCPQEYLPGWFGLLDQLFPSVQFFVTLGEKDYKQLPASLLSETLPDFPVADNSRSRKKYVQRPNLPSQSIFLVDVDSRLPNLALMKLSNYYKSQGYHIELIRKETYDPRAEMVFASSIFNSAASWKRIDKMRAFYGSNFDSGGSGIDTCKRLPPEIEQTQPDYGLYPELGDRAMGFLTRGCRFRCNFCIVPQKEGNTRIVDSIDNLTRGIKDKLILLDDNILSHRQSKELLEEMARKKLRVNFNQTLDLTLIDREKAKLLKSISCCNVKFTRNVYHFSLNDNRNLEEIRSKYRLLNFSGKDNVEFICMYGYNTTLAQDLERFRFLHSLPGAYVFVQKYMPVPGGPQPDLENFFDEHADEYIDELVNICFTQNMKSMEKYYRWLSRLYVETFGKLHMGLVNTIFRYNSRYERGRYIASMAGTQKLL